LHKRAPEKKSRYGWLVAERDDAPFLALTAGFEPATTYWLKVAWTSHVINNISKLSAKPVAKIHDTS
jgi:hypothetical protein